MAGWLVKMNKCVEISQMLSQRPSETSDNIQEAQAARWLYKQRKRMEQEKLLPEQQSALQQYMTEYNIISYEQKWNGHLEQCIQFTEQYGRYPSQKSIDDYERQLGGWFVNQRIVGRNLSAERQQKIDQYLQQFDYKSKSQQWLEKYNECVDILKQQIVPNKHSKNKTHKRVGSWLYNQKRYLKQGKLSAEKQQLIQSLQLV